MMEEFDRMLDELGWRRVDLARRLGLAKESISRWPRPPAYALAYLRAMIELKHMRDRLERLLAP